MRLEDGSGVVGQSPYHRGVEGNPVCDAVGIGQIEQRRQLCYRGAAPTQRSCERIQIPESQSRLDGGYRISTEALLCELLCDDIVREFAHLVDDDAGRREGVP